MQGERFISQKIQEVGWNWETNSNLTHGHLFFFTDLKKRKRNPTTNPISLVLALMNCSRQLILFCFFSQLSSIAEAFN